MRRSVPDRSCCIAAKPHHNLVISSSGRLHIGSHVHQNAPQCIAAHKNGGDCLRPRLRAPSIAPKAHAMAPRAAGSGSLWLHSSAENHGDCTPAVAPVNCFGSRRGFQDLLSRLRYGARDAPVQKHAVAARNRAPCRICYNFNVAPDPRGPQAMARSAANVPPRRDRSAVGPARRCSS